MACTMTFLYSPALRGGARVLRRSSVLFVLLAGALAPAAAPALPPQGPAPQVAAVLETHVPDLSKFLLRGTVPIPAGIFPRADNRNPFMIVDYDGTPVLTQAEVVSRYPLDADGADVVELLAHVRRNPALATGASARYTVLYDSTPVPLTTGAWDDIPPAVRALVDDPDGLEIAAYDCFGNKYVSRPFSAPRTFQQRHHGPIQFEARIHQNMVPVTPIPGSTLPHLFGVHAYISVFRSSWNVSMDLRFSNGHDGNDHTTTLDDPLDKVYFRKIELSVPDDWVVMQDLPDPLFGAERQVNGRRIVTLVGPNANGKLHVMRWLGQFHRRLALAPDAGPTVTSARAMLDGVGRAFCVRGSYAGTPFWSWWNPATSRYFPQRHQLPHLDHVGDAALEADLATQLDFLADHLAAGTGTGNYPLAAGRLGWGHPYGVAYGGMTSGLEINCYDGIEAAAAASPTGFRLYSTLHRMQTDRQPNALYQLDGEPSTVEEWLVENGAQDYVPMEFFVVPFTNGSRPDPFGIRQAPQFQINFVAANGLQPTYEAQHLGFEPHDYQHFIRYTRSAKVLAWLANDSLAIDDLRLQAENFHLGFHQHYDDQFGGVPWSGVISMTRYVRSFPAKGCQFGRGEAWGMDCAVAAYALLDPEWRAKKRPWFEQQVELLRDAQPPCNGFIQANVSSQGFNGQYRSRQLIEQSITENALVGLRETVFRGADPGHTFMVRSLLVGSLRAFISDMAWFPGMSGPFRYTGVGPLDPSLPVWCSRADMAPGTWTAGDLETYQDWSSFAYGYELTGDPVFLQFAGTQAGGSSFADLAWDMEISGLNNIENRVALLAAVQVILGEL